MAIEPSCRPYSHPLYENLLSAPGLSVLSGSLDDLLTWGALNSLWVFPMATSCCGIELMAAAASRVDLDRMGTIVRATPRQADVIVVAGTITVKMAPRVKKLWDQMPEPKWCVAMGSCAISGDFYRDMYPVVPGVDTFLPVDVYVPGCPPNPEELMHGLMRLQEKVRLIRSGNWVPPRPRPETDKMIRPIIGRMDDPDRDRLLSQQQIDAALAIGRETDQRRVQHDVRRLPMLNGVSDQHSARSDAENLVSLLRQRFGIIDWSPGPPPLIDAAQHVELAKTLKLSGYNLLVFIVATHFPATDNDSADIYEVTCGLRTTGPDSQLATWRVRVEDGRPVPSLAGVFAGADWQEREQYDLLGVVFSGHQDLRRILLPGDWKGHPLRRDYPSNAEQAPWR